MNVIFPTASAYFRHDTEQDFRNVIERSLRDAGLPTRLVDAPERYMQREADHLRRLITITFTRANITPPVLPPAPARYSEADATLVRRILVEAFARLP